MISMPDLFIFAQAFPGILVGFVNFPAGLHCGKINN